MKSVKHKIISLTLLFIGANICFGVPTTYTGSLSVGSGLIGTGGYNVPTTSISWVVDNVTTPGLWHYSYTLTTPTQSISHIIIEASDGDPWEQFTSANLFSPTSDPDGWIGSIAIQIQSSDGANPDMPEDMYGIKFNQGGVQQVVTVSFDSDRVPVWGDFYSKDGTEPVPGGGGDWNTVYNAGFTSPDYDPTDPASNGSVEYHLLVPDTYIPAPGAILLGAIGIGFVNSLRRRRML